MNIIIYTLVTVQITIACVTLYLHRSQSHKAVQFHPVVNHFMRAWLWLTTGMVTKQWVAIHRKHHQRSDQEGDPHSPQIYGIWRVLFGGAFLYHSASKDTAMVDSLSKDCPNDWIERNLYSAHSRLGILLMLVIDLVLFGPWGLVVWSTCNLPTIRVSYIRPRLLWLEPEQSVLVRRVRPARVSSNATDTSRTRR